MHPVPDKKDPQRKENSLTLLLRHTDSSSTTASSLGVLSSDTETPVMSETPVSTDFLEPLQILTELVVEGVGKNLRVLSVDNITLTIEEPGGDLILGRVLDDSDDTLKLFGGKFTSALVQVDISLLADQVGITPSNTLDLGQGIHDLLLTVHIVVEETQDKLEVRFLTTHERHGGWLV